MTKTLTRCHRCYGAIERGERFAYEELRSGAEAAVHVHLLNPAKRGGDKAAGEGE